MLVTGVRAVLVAVAASTGATIATQPAHAIGDPVAEDGLSRLGLAYLRAHPREGTVGALRARLSELDASQPVRGQLPLLSSRIQAEFDNRSIVRVRGWVLARSEARGAALVSLGE